MTILDEIVRHKREEVDRRRGRTALAALEARCRTLPPPRDVEGALRPPPGGVRLIAEVKQASPSRGVFAAALPPLDLASTYARHGAHVISVLTDEKYFRGSLDLLVAVRGRVDTPLLRKDFTIDEYQLWESRAAGADAVLLIVSILDPGALRDLAQAAKGLGLAALVECHTEAEVDTALSIGTGIIGINNRDLATFETRIDTTLALLPRIPPGPVVVSESGFADAAQVRRVVAAGAHAILVGEGLVTSPDVPAKIRELTLTEDRDAPPGPPEQPPAGAATTRAPGGGTAVGGDTTRAPGGRTAVGGDSARGPGGNWGGRPAPPNLQ